MDQHGNIYDLNGNFVATIDNEDESNSIQNSDKK